MYQKILYNFLIAIDAIRHNKMRGILTSLGIIFGVGSVISMLAIGEGAQQEILEQIRLLGANNIIVTPEVEQKEGQTEEEQAASTSKSQEEKKRFTPGLTLSDAHNIAVIPGVIGVSPEVVVETNVIRSGYRRTGKLVGVDVDYFRGGGFELESGDPFTRAHMEERAPVAIIGQSVKQKFFAKENAVGKQIKCGHLWLTVVGVLKEKHISEQHIEHLGLRDFNLDIYTPVTTLLVRYEDRAKLTQQMIRRANQRRRNNQSKNYNQVDRLTVRVASSDMVRPVADVTSRMLERRHYGVVDYQVIVPEALLAQERRTQNIFNIVLASIASISLLVGGIGIMNIMLASVMERINEIGIRRSMGATQHDVILQFLIEAISISVTGGIIGVLLGVAASLTIEAVTGIETIVTAAAVLLAFLVSVSVGLVFGLLPARRAAKLDPVVALRHD